MSAPRLRSLPLRVAIPALAATAAAVLTAAGCAPQHDSSTTGGKTATSRATGSATPAGSACSPGGSAYRTKGRLTVATDSPAYSPWFDSNKPSDGKGFESAVAYAVAKRLGFARSQVHWVVEPFDNSYAPGAKNFDFDINEISVTPQRAKAVDFSTGYYTATQGVLTLSSNRFAHASSLTALKKARIGVQVATTSYKAVLGSIAPSHRPSVYNTTNDEVNALKNGQIDAIVTDMPTVFYLASAELSHARILGQFDYDHGTPEKFGLLLEKGSALTPCVDKAIAGLTSDGTLAHITDTWLSASAHVPHLKP